MRLRGEALETGSCETLFEVSLCAVRKGAILVSLTPTGTRMSSTLIPKWDKSFLSVLLRIYINKASYPSCPQWSKQVIEPRECISPYSLLWVCECVCQCVCDASSSFGKLCSHSPLFAEGTVVGSKEPRVVLVSLNSESQNRVSCDRWPNHTDFDDWRRWAQLRTAVEFTVLTKIQVIFLN